MRKIREVTEKHNIVLILDEVQSRFGRSGTMFAFEQSGIEPDVVVMSKAVGGSLPLAVLAIKRKFDAWQPAGHTGTFRGNQMAMGTGLATINTIRDEKLAENAKQRGEWLKTELENLKAELPCIGHVRGRGLMLGIEIVDERQQPDRLGAYPADSQLAAEIQRACFEHKLLLEKGGRGGTVIRLLCPLIITHDECVEVIKRFKEAVKDALKTVRGSAA